MKIPNNQFNMPFGKHKGVLMTNLPSNYLEWLANTPTIGNNIKYRAKDILNTLKINEKELTTNYERLINSQ